MYISSPASNGNLSKLRHGIDDRGVAFFLDVLDRALQRRSHLVTVGDRALRRSSPCLLQSLRSRAVGFEKYWADEKAGVV